MYKNAFQIPIKSYLLVLLNICKKVLHVSVQNVDLWLFMQIGWAYAKIIMFYHMPHFVISLN